jgi:hypothetical protein
MLMEAETLEYGRLAEQAHQLRLKMYEQKFGIPARFRLESTSADSAFHETSGIRGDPRPHLEQVAEWPRLALLVFLEGFPRHAADHVALLDKALFPGFFVGQRSQNL